MPKPIRETRVLKLVFITIPCLKFWAQGIFVKTSFGTRVSRIELGSFVNIDIFVLKYHFI